MAGKARASAGAPAAARWDAAMREAKERTVVLRRLLEDEWTQPAGIEAQRPPDG